MSKFVRCRTAWRFATRLLVSTGWKVVLYCSDGPMCCSKYYVAEASLMLFAVAMKYCG